MKSNNYSQITNKKMETISNEIKAKVFAPYIGQQFVFDNQTREDDIHEMEGVFTHMVYSTEMDDSGEGVFGIEDCKLLLTPLSKISDEDKEYCYHRHCENCSYDYTQDYDTINIAIEKWIAKKPNEIYYLSSQYQYLQSKGYDLPNYLLGNKTLIESGIALDKTLI